MVLELLIEIIEELTQETCALLSSFDQGHTTNALPSPSKVRLANGCAENSHTFFDDYSMLSDKPSQPSPLDVAPTDLPTRGSEEAIFALQTTGSAPPYTSERSFHKSN